MIMVSRFDDNDNMFLCNIIYICLLEVVMLLETFSQTVCELYSSIRIEYLDNEIN